MYPGSQFSTAPPGRPKPLRVQLTNREKGIYSNLWSRADPDNTGKVEGRMAVEFFQKSALPVEVLKQVWSISTPNGEGFLDRERFYVAMRLIALAQQGRPVTTESILNNVEVDLPKFTLGSAMDQSDSFDIAPDDRQLFENIFNHNCQGRPALSGNDARMLFERTGVDISELGKIWGMCDPMDTGVLTRNQFVVAMQLITKVKNRVRIPDTLPPNLAAMLTAPSSPAQVPQLPVQKRDAFDEFAAFDPGKGPGMKQPPGMLPGQGMQPPGMGQGMMQPPGMGQGMMQPGIGQGMMQPPGMGQGMMQPPGMGQGMMQPGMGQGMMLPPQGPIQGGIPAGQGQGMGAMQLPPQKPVKKQDPPAKKMDAFEDFPDSAPPMAVFPGNKRPEAVDRRGLEQPAIQQRGFDPSKNQDSLLEPDPFAMKPRKPEPKPDDFAREAPPRAESRANNEEVLRAIKSLEARVEELSEELRAVKKEVKVTRETSMQMVDEVGKDVRKHREQTANMGEELFKELRTDRRPAGDSGEGVKAANKQLSEALSQMAALRTQCEESLKQHQLVSMQMTAFFQQIAAIQAGKAGMPQRPMQVPVDPQRPMQAPVDPQSRPVEAPRPAEVSRPQVDPRVEPKAPSPDPRRMEQPRADNFDSGFAFPGQKPPPREEPKEVVRRPPPEPPRAAQSDDFEFEPPKAVKQRPDVPPIKQMPKPAPTEFNFDSRKDEPQGKGFDFDLPDSRPPGKPKAEGFGLPPGKDNFDSGPSKQFDFGAQGKGFEFDFEGGKSDFSDFAGPQKQQPGNQKIDFDFS